MVVQVRMSKGLQKQLRSGEFEVCSPYLLSICILVDPLLKKIQKDDLHPIQGLLTG